MYYQNNAYGNGGNLGNGLGFGPFDWSNTTPQLFTLKGKVIDGSTNKPLTPANIYYTKNGQKVGVITNNYGEYELQASPTDEIIISFLGYEHIEATAGKIKAIEYLYPKNEQLEEVIVNATKKPDNTKLFIGLSVFALAVIATIASKKETKTPQTT